MVAAESLQMSLCLVMLMQHFHERQQASHSLLHLLHHQTPANRVQEYVVLVLAFCGEQRPLHKCISQYLQYGLAP